jgi:hypothetical protein
MVKKRIAILLVLTLTIPNFLIETEGNGLPEWTVMVYLDGDNNLEEYGINDFLEMASVGSTNDVNILVQFDRIDGYDTRYDDWTDARRFIVQKDMLPNSSNALVNLGEVDMSDPLVLFDFMNWSATNYEAKKYFLIIWDHGAGWEGIVNDVTNAPGSLMSTPELALALEMFHNSTGRKVDVVAFDACRMMLEMIYEVRDYADFVVGSEKDVPDRGFPYDTFLESIVALPKMTAYKASKNLVDAYVDFYTGKTSYAVTLSSVKSSYMDDLRVDLNAFLEEILLELPFFSEEVRDARTSSEFYEGDNQYDLFNFLENIQSAVPSGWLYDLAEDVKDTITNAVYERKWDNPGSLNSRATNAHGLTIWLPELITDPEYLNLAWSNDTYWNEFLAIYNTNLIKPQASLEVAHAFLDTDGNGYTDRISLNMSSDQNGELIVDVYDEFASDYLSTHIYGLTSGNQERDTIPLTDNTHFSLSFYLRNQSGVLQNYTELTIPKVLKIKGTVKDMNGEALNLDITLVNTRTSDSLNTVSDSSGFEFVVQYPIWARDGDLLELEYEYDGEVKTLQIIPDFTLSYYSIHIVLDSEQPDDGDNENAFSSLALLIVFIQILTILFAFAFSQKHTIIE